MAKIIQLPDHLQKCVENYRTKCESFGIDPDWAIKAYKKAEENKDDFALIHGLIT